MARSVAVAGGVLGVVGVLIAMAVSGLDFVLVIRDENIEVSRTLVGMSWGLVGVLGGVMGWSNPKVPGVVMLVSGVAGIITMPAYFSGGGVLLLVAAAMALSWKSNDAGS